MVTLLFTTSWREPRPPGVPPAEQGSNFDRVTIVCIANAWRKFVWTSKPSPNSVTVIVAPRRLGKPRRRAEQRDQKKNSCVFHRCFFLLYF
jgi:hypothetical protein